jgi:DNA-binding FrmR family transcriptional regulator
MLSTEEKKAAVHRLKRVEGQVAGLCRMVNEDRYCVDVLVQISAAQGALAKIGELVLSNHIRTCVRDAFDHGKDQERQETIEELVDVFARYGGFGPR